MVTTALDLAGSLLVILGVSLFVSALSPAGAVVLAGVLVLLLSMLVDRKKARP